jgi:cytochrome c-type biogenesis protein
VITDYIALFGAGVASFLAPCLVPLVPAYLGMIVGESGDSGDTAAAVPATIIFIAGFAAVFAALGVAAGSIGSSLSSVQDVLQRVGGVIVVVMGLILLGVVRGRLVRERRVINRLPNVGGSARPLMLGVAFGAAWSPCVGPLLGAALVVAAHGGQPVRGGLLLLAYAAGIGVPFLLASLGLAASPGIAARVRSIGPALERIGGVLLVVLGVLLATGTYAHLTSYLAQFAPSVGGV